MKGRHLDFLVVTLSFVVLTSAAFIFNLKPLIASFIILVIPSAYLMLREPKPVAKILWPVFLFGGLLGFVFDLAETFNRAWVMERLVFPQKVLGVVPVDDILGFLFMVLFIVVFYRHFLDRESGNKLSANLGWGIGASLLAFAGSIGIFFAVEPDMLRIPYAYLAGGILAVAFPAFVVIRNPRLVPKLLRLAAFFFFVWFAAEVIALKTGGWSFPGEYVAMVPFFGVSIPFEEVLFWMLLYAPAVAAYYEFFIDDLK